MDLAEVGGEDDLLGLRSELFIEDAHRVAGIMSTSDHVVAA